MAMFNNQIQPADLQMAWLATCHLSKSVAVEQHWSERARQSPGNCTECETSAFQLCLAWWEKDGKKSVDLRWHDSTFWGVEPCTSWLSHWEIVETNSLKPLEVLDKYSKKKSIIWLAEQTNDTSIRHIGPVWSRATSDSLALDQFRSSISIHFCWIHIFSQDGKRHGTQLNPFFFPSAKSIESLKSHTVIICYNPIIWVCLKIGYIPNYSHLIGIMIINHWV